MDRSDAAVLDLPPAYADLERRFARWGSLKEAEGVLHWDMSTMMPKGGAADRADQLAALRVVTHGMITDPALGDLFPQAETERGRLDPWRQANLREMHLSWRHATALPEKLVEAMSHACTRCEMAWRQSRPAGDFKAVLPHLREVLHLTRETASAKADALGLSPYDALLDLYEPGGRAAEIDVLFADLASFLPGFLEQALARQGGRPAPLPLTGPFPVEKQRALALELMTALGFDFDHGRLDVSLHPFCGGTPGDVRITTRYDEASFMPALMGVLHETGHALYERGLPESWRRQPVGRARGMSLHESQSLLIEMQACRSRAFISFVAPLMRRAFGGDGPAWQVDNLLGHYRRVSRGLIRVDADEVTYPAHVILRYRLERALIAGEMDLADLPTAWNAGMKELLGVVPPDDRDGCMQDIHWYDGAWGYFPTYTLGAMTAAQLFAAARAADPAIEPGIARGDFRPLLAWLRPNVHERGSRDSTDEIVTAATGRPLDTTAFKAHLTARYLEDA
jgi:carboxypeptidase Taq